MTSPLLSYYGDDFTGSTDVMEALATHGVQTVLFTRIPSTDEFEPFSGRHAFGLAGTSRSQTPEWMDEHLPPAFAWARSLGARFFHYKVCSTFDSAPQVGSIGRAIEIGARIFAQDRVPLIVGAPQLKRYTFAGHLFAAYQGQVHRIDRHPVMSRHPVTPMDESDLRIHLSRQTSLPVHLASETSSRSGIELVDVHDAATQLQAGENLLALPGGTFVAGSSGVEYALMSAMGARGDGPGVASFAPVAAVKNLIAVSGSVSPTTERQIRHSLANGFEGLAADPLELAGDNRAATMERLTREAVRHMEENRSVLVYTALGHASDLGAKLDAIPSGRRRIGEALGTILRDVIRQTSARRAVISGGDTSSHALGQLDVHALTTRFPLKATPGSPLCTAYSATAEFNGIEIAMKGGQVGADDYFVALRDGLA